MPPRKLAGLVLWLAGFSIASGAMAQAAGGKPAYDPVAGQPACARPEWPAASLAAGDSGVVTLKLLIDVDGAVVDSRVLRSSGHEALDEAARIAMLKCHFNPGLKDGKPVKAWLMLQYVWKPD
ncbi:energy transducer TonB [Oxalobacteraceae bacterium A2-2]